ncbi:hypothetical protein FWH13_03630 [Candidatus Saccharibacteria bacterium]|nr:hypothetical protein [Candidatus Saccharibacteria bacterium]
MTRTQRFLKFLCWVLIVGAVLVSVIAGATLNAYLDLDLSSLTGRQIYQLSVAYTAVFLAAFVALAGAVGLFALFAIRRAHRKACTRTPVPKTLPTTFAIYITIGCAALAIVLFVAYTLIGP